VDVKNTIVTHDSGNVRDQVTAFWEALAPNSYLGWGNSTQLGTSLGMAMGAKMAAPDKLCINFLGDTAFGMCGMDLETAVRERIPILTVLINNGAMGGYDRYMPVASEKYKSRWLTGDYLKVADGLGYWAERVTDPAEIVPALERAKAVIASGRPAMLECMTRENPVWPMLGYGGR
jgi:thiamine pyrophosphate-dependent acetolactate synthase large subunit-like protein